jgi:hypothetical protein
MPRIDAERYDLVNLVDPTLGISGQLRIYDMNKRYAARSGEFRQTLSLA